VKKALDSYEPTHLPDEIQRELARLMLTEARRYGMERLPEVH
jgi:hypothetical protein